MSTTTEFEYHTETIGGVEIEKPMPKRLHALVQTQLLFLLQLCLEHSAAPFQVVTELDMWCGKDRRCPDLLLFRQDAIFRGGILASPAVLAVEILSPGQTIANLFDRCQVYFRAGVPWCWVLWPETRRAWVYTPEELIELKPTQSLILSGVTLDIAIPLKSVYARLPVSEDA